MKGLLEKMLKLGLMDVDGGTQPGGTGNDGPKGTDTGNIDNPANTGTETWQVNLDPELADILKPQADKFKEMGVSAPVAQKFIDNATAEMKQYQAAIDKEMSDLTAKWGGKDKTQANINTAVQTMEKLGFTQEEAAALTKTLGASKVYERFFDISKKMGADNFKDHNSSAVVYQPNNLDAAQAQAEVDRLQKDTAFMAKINDNDPEAVAKLDRLIDIANGVR